MLDIKCGNPNGNEPASYSRFVLPFAYTLTPAKEDRRSALSYVPITADEERKWRENYLTKETADVLFKRARWLKLQNNSITNVTSWEWKYPMVFRDEHILDVCMSAPMLVLFECPESMSHPIVHISPFVSPNAQSVNEGRRKHKAGEPDLLRTGFLIVELYFPESRDERPNLNDLLEMNELFRYWQKPYEGNAEDKHLLNKWPVEVIDTSSTNPDNSASPRNYSRWWKSLLAHPIILDDSASDIRPQRSVPLEDMSEVQGTVKDRAHKKYDLTTDLTVYADPRTFVWTCAIIKGGVNRLRKEFVGPGLDIDPFGHWIRLVNVDKPEKTAQETHKTTAFEREWGHQHTYRRWEERDTYYGFNYHCGAMLGEICPEPPTWRYFGSMYFDQVLLLLYLRVTLFRFSTRLGEISATARDRDNEEEWREDFQKLRWDFALFTNLYQFPLISNQQQAIEMYALARKCMDIEELFREIQEEIKSGHDYLIQKQAQEQTQTAMLLTVVATLGLMIALPMSFFSMGILIEGLKNQRSHLLLFGIGLSISFILLMSVIWISQPVSRQINRLANLHFNMDLAERRISDGKTLPESRGR